MTQKKKRCYFIVSGLPSHPPLSYVVVHARYSKRDRTADTIDSTKRIIAWHSCFAQSGQSDHVLLVRVRVGVEMIGHSILATIQALGRLFVAVVLIEAHEVGAVALLLGLLHPFAELFVLRVQSGAVAETSQDVETLQASRALQPHTHGRHHYNAERHGQEYHDQHGRAEIVLVHSDATVPRAVQSVLVDDFLFV
jgi:hypothetical protein